MTKEVFMKSMCLWAVLFGSACGGTILEDEWDDDASGAPLTVAGDATLVVTTNASVTSQITYDNIIPSMMTQAMIDQIKTGGCIPKAGLHADSGVFIQWLM